MDWNPGKTGTLGLQWFPIKGGATNLDSATKLVATSFDQSVSQAAVDVGIPNVGIAVRNGIYAIEVYDNETAVGDTATTSLLSVPNEDVTDGLWLNQAGNNTNLFASIDDGVTVNTADYIRISGASSTVTQRMNTGSLTLTGRRILAVHLDVYAVLGPTGFLSTGLNIGGVDYTGVNNAAGPAASRTYRATWLYNPATKKPWTIADVQALDTTDEIWMRGQTQAGVWSVVDVYAVSIQVISVTENRLAVGTLDDSGAALTVGTFAAPAINRAALLTPTGGAWTKDGTGRHLYTARRISSSGSMALGFLDTETIIGFATQGRSWSVLMDPTYGFPLLMVDPLTALYSFIPRTTGPTNSVDGIPWAKTAVASVYTGRTAEQEISGAAAANYGILRFYVNNASHSASSLDVKIKRRSDNVQLGTTYSLTDAVASTFPVASVGSFWRLVQVQIPAAATLAAATQYYIEFSSASPSSTPWSVVGLDSFGFGPEQTYDGTTDAATINNLARNTSIDLLVTLATIPTAPASMTATLGSQTVSESVNCVTSIPRADLSWTATSLAGLFTRYELQRSEDAGVTWVDIADVTVESVVAWKDYEARRGVAALYRIRVVRNDGAFSSWTQAGASVTKPLLSGTGAYGATMHLVSNYSPTTNMAVEYRPAKDYTFHEADEQQLQGAYGLDFQLGANPIENRGLSAAWTLLVGVDDKIASGTGWSAFDALRSLARAQFPYVCVLDHNGNRLLAQLRVPNGNEDTSGGAARYLAQVTGTQLAAVPYVVQVAA